MHHPISLLFITSLLSLTTALPSLPKPHPHLLPRQNSSTSAVPLADGASVQRAGTTLNADAAAEANPRDDTATRAFTSTPIKTSGGQCLSIDPAAGDFRENLIPVALQACDGSAGQNFDVITAGKHIQAAGGALVVSSLVSFFLNPRTKKPEAEADRTRLFTVTDARVPELRPAARGGGHGGVVLVRGEGGWRYVVSFFFPPFFVLLIFEMWRKNIANEYLRGDKQRAKRQTHKSLRSTGATS